MTTYRNTRIYLRSLDLILIDLCDRILRELPVGFGFMADQIRRAASSVTLNFAEGCGRSTKAERRRFFTIARGSAQEVAAAIDVLDHFGVLRVELRLAGLDACDHLAAMLVRFV